jgi:hypothetical protein
MTMAAVCNESPAALGWYRPERLEDGGGDRRAGIPGDRPRARALIAPWPLAVPGSEVVPLSSRRVGLWRDHKRGR